MGNRASTALWGVVFILLGILFGGNAFDIWDVNLFFNGWWTLFIIVPSVLGLFQKGFKSGSLIGLIIGVLLLLSAQDIITWAMMGKLFIPIMFILIGFSIIFGSKSNRDRTIHVNKKGLQDFTAIFSGNNVNFPYEKFNGANITSIFGSVDLNLKNAIINEDVVINTLNIFGGSDILVPPGVKVKVSSVPIFGGVSNKTNQVQIEGAPTIYINATCIFGGVDIK